jgi:hypothetical protein
MFRADEAYHMNMICDLCKEDSDRIIRAGAWQVCQWCVSNNVLEHALEVEVDIAKLDEAVDKTSATHQRDVRNEAAADKKLELAYAAYAELTSAMKELATSTENSKWSLRLALAAKEALKDYKDKEREKTRKARQHI